MKLIVVAIIVVVLILIGVGIWLMMRNKNKMPKLDPDVPTSYEMRDSFALEQGEFKEVSAAPAVAVFEVTFHASGPSDRGILLGAFPEQNRNLEYSQGHMKFFTGLNNFNVTDNSFTFEVDRRYRIVAYFNGNGRVEISSIGMPTVTIPFPHPFPAPTTEMVMIGKDYRANPSFELPATIHACRLYYEPARREIFY